PVLDTPRPDIEAEIKTGKWDAVVFQGASVSSSHKYRYSQEVPIRLAKVALSSGARALLFVEWPRRGWDESDFQMGVYKEIQRGAPKSELVPICYVWDKVRALEQGRDLWLPDGNHAALEGSFLAACTIYRFVTKSRRLMPSWKPEPVSSRFASECHKTAIEVAGKFGLFGPR
ncbi:MAG TPA: hypothetical protein VG944_20575, partial [Fimbriimonas sp.]|nr:hypothetical protein [Fimbriimonas sp.]